jgi:hypothetical protein
MLRRGREQKIHLERALSLLVPMRYKRKIPISMHLIRRKRKRKRNQRRQQILRRKKEKNHMIVLFAGAWSIGRVNAQTANLHRRRNQ